MNRPAGTALAAALLMALAACSGGGSGKGDESGSPPAGDTAAAVPVDLGRIVRDTLRVIVTASGRTQVLREETVRAPFAGTLTELRVTDGDRVREGDLLGRLVARSSEAAMEGAQAMLASARDAADSADAKAALALARREWVERVLKAPAAGVVLSHAATEGDRLGEGDEIVKLAAAGSAVFQAEVSQSDLARVKPGQRAWVRLSARADSLLGAVHGVLPTAAGDAFSAPVRIDLVNGLDVPAVGLFGTATIVVGERRGVLSAPAEAVITDDVTGISRVAAVRGGIAVWDTVRTGVADRGRVEITGPGVSAGETVIVNGQVGLPDSAAVRARS